MLSQLFAFPTTLIRARALSDDPARKVTRVQIHCAEHLVTTAAGDAREAYLLDRLRQAASQNPQALTRTVRRVAFRAFLKRVGASLTAIVNGVMATAAVARSTTPRYRLR